MMQGPQNLATSFSSCSDVKQETGASQVEENRAHAKGDPLCMVNEKKLGREADLNEEPTKESESEGTLRDTIATEEAESKVRRQDVDDSKSTVKITTPRKTCVSKRVW